AKQIMLTSIPLFFLKPQNSVILFDQPETSLYPNVQLMLPEVYTNTARNNNQFFFATHSPIVASAFDPWEIVELIFGTDGIERREYYSGTTRTVEKYFLQPKLLRWDSNYMQLFGLDDEGREERAEKLNELAVLDNQLKKTTDKNEKAQIF